MEAMNNKYLVYVVEDNELYLEMLIDELSEISSIEVEGFSSGEDFMKELHRSPDIVVLDYFLNKENPNAQNGMQVLEEIENELPNPKVIILSSQLMPDVTFDFVTKEGVYSYVVKEDGAFEKVKEAIYLIIDELQGF